MRAIFLAAALVVASGPGHAQDTSLAIELNALTPTDAGCRVTFMATNNLGTDIGKSAVEVALFGTGGGIERLVSLDFKSMPSGKTKVLQFDLADVSCDSVSRVLINDVSACDGAGLDPGLCLAKLVTRTNTDVAFGV